MQFYDQIVNCRCFSFFSTIFPLSVIDKWDLIAVNEKDSFLEWKKKAFSHAVNRLTFGAKIEAEQSVEEK